MKENLINLALKMSVVQPDNQGDQMFKSGHTADNGKIPNL